MRSHISSRMVYKAESSKPYPTMQPALLSARVCPAVSDKRPTQIRTLPDPTPMPPLMFLSLGRKATYSCREVQIGMCFFKLSWARLREGAMDQSFAQALCSAMPPSCQESAEIRNVPVTPTPSISPKVLPYKWGTYCRTNGRRTAKGNGRRTAGFPFFDA